MKTLGEKIRELRRKKGLSQEELGFEIGISRQTVSKWESDSMQPTTENIRALCDFFSVTAEYFIGDDKPTALAETQESVATSATPDSFSTTFESNTVTIATKSYSKKRIAVLTILISLSIVIFVVSAMIGAIALSNLTPPDIGMDDHIVPSADILAIVGCIVAFAALTATITLIILLKRENKRK